MLSLQELAIKTIIKNDIVDLYGQHHLERLVVEFCGKYPERVPHSPQSYWKLRSSYLFLSERKVECKYFGPGDIYSPEITQTFLNDATNLTTKFINSELRKYVDLDKSYFTSRELLMFSSIPYKAYFEFTPEYIKQSGTKYKELGLETTIMSMSSVKKAKCAKILFYNMAYTFKHYVFADHIYKYKPVTYVCPREKNISVLHSLSAFAAHKNKPVFVFDDDLRFVDECVDQRGCEQIFEQLLERIRWFRSTIHAQYMSELHFMLLDCDVTHRVLNIMTLFPSVFFEVKDVLLDEAQPDEA